jgi:hypothetical protein
MYHYSLRKRGLFSEISGYRGDQYEDGCHRPDDVRSKRRRLAGCIAALPPDCSSSPPCLLSVDVFLQ